MYGGLLARIGIRLFLMGGGSDKGNRGGIEYVLW